MEPPVSDPSAAKHILAATAAAEPPLLPPGTREGSQGLTVRLRPEFSVLEPIANSSRLVLPRITASAAASRSMTWASYGLLKFTRIFEAQVVGAPCRQMLSLIA